MGDHPGNSQESLLSECCSSPPMVEVSERPNDYLFKSLRAPIPGAFRSLRAKASLSYRVPR